MLSADRLALVQAGVSREAIVAALGEPQRTRRLQEGDMLRYREVETLWACRVYLLCFIPLGSTRRTTTLDLRLEDDRLVSATMKRSGSGPNSRTVIVSPETPDDACAVLPIFEIYRQKGALSRTAGTLDLDLPVDLHATRF